MAKTQKQWDEVFEDYAGCEWDDIRDYVETVKPEYADTLRANIIADMSFPNIKREFYKKYYPQYIPVAKEKKPTMLEWADAAKAAEKKAKQKEQAKIRAKQRALEKKEAKKAEKLANKANKA